MCYESIFDHCPTLISNTFMTLAWYGHLKFAEWKWFSKLSLISVILISWGIALLNISFKCRQIK